MKENRKLVSPEPSSCPYEKLSLANETLSFRRDAPRSAAAPWVRCVPWIHDAAALRFESRLSDGEIGPLILHGAFAGIQRRNFSNRERNKLRPR